MINIELDISDTERISLLKRLVDVLNENNVDYCIGFGTLLGCIRDKKMIPWDYDIDIGTVEINKVLSLIPKFEEKSLVVNYFPGTKLN